ncbi:hypothetical protein [Desulfosporosinus nitroreducens]|uniref:Uncharacterized protein n=1 Tax=Desulfosporosinus nitroreducens TaxID=2018668 RepID=A0ABT8QN21_9FIRM|nr:hypothetical protein [Desulfosporosinus nitroreducens]MCO1603294.1 hypothetical protein [Desulfosporosinus nitroreducens]MDO0822701.1 hypothetical protein [Desulfosporosinus nitroreducens]
MSLENFKFTFEENEEGYTVNLKGDKEKLRAKLEAFEAFLNFREKAKQAGFDHHGSESPIHQFFKAMHKHHANHGGGHGHCGHHGHHAQHPFKHGQCGESSKGEAPVSQDLENK